jgi:glycosidase
VQADKALFSPGDARYKTPYGAVPSGTQVQFTLRPPRAAGFSHGILIARFEFEENRTVRVPLLWWDTDGSRDLFSGSLDTGDYVGLVWYSFQLTGLDGRFQTLGEYQLTVYDGTKPIPGWFGAGMTYQIFPDRFRRTSVPDPTGLVGERTVHSGWDEAPEYRPDVHGEVRNRDFFGGNLAGVLEKLPYIRSLGTETIYFCPVFEAAENHRYGTGNYEKLDPMFGTNEEFSAFCTAAHRLGMRVVLDGVFNHTGFISRYFNGDGSYPDVGAHQSRNSPYYDWFTFSRWPDRYDSWWGIYSLPAVNESASGYQDYIFGGADSIVRRWLRAGADGWRLDVADELPDRFVAGIHAAARAEKPESVVIGEVWEDGTTKVAYGVRRRHLLGGHCDGLMNYPFRTALLAWLLGGDAGDFRDTMEVLREHYPKSAFYSSMNILGTHDTPRILTLLGIGSNCAGMPKAWRANYHMTEEERARGIARLKVAAVILFSFPGSPTVYYGDEAGLEGFEDPFNRRTFPWGREDKDLTAWFSRLGNLRGTLMPLRRGGLHYLRAEGPVLAFSRIWGGESILAAANAGGSMETLCLTGFSAVEDLMTGVVFTVPEDGDLNIPLPPVSARLLRPWRRM